MKNAWPLVLMTVRYWLLSSAAQRWGKASSPRPRPSSKSKTPEASSQLSNLQQSSVRSLRNLPVTMLPAIFLRRLRRRVCARLRFFAAADIPRCVWCVGCVGIRDEVQHAIADYHWVEHMVCEW